MEVDVEARFETRADGARQTTGHENAIPGDSVYRLSRKAEIRPNAAVRFSAELAYDTRRFSAPTAPNAEPGEQCNPGLIE